MLLTTFSHYLALLKCFIKTADAARHHLGALLGYTVLFSELVKLVTLIPDLVDSG
jgi:hypothetical protein